MGTGRLGRQDPDIRGRPGILAGPMSDRTEAATSSAEASLEALRIDRTPAGPRRRKRKRWVVVGVLLVLLGAVVAGPVREALSVPRVTTATVRRVSSVEGSIRTSASGYVVARRRASISSRLSGRLETLLVDVGDRVEKGQLLGQLGHEDLKATVRETEAILAQRRADLGMAVRDKAVAEAELAAARQRLEDARALERVETERLAETERLLALEEKLVAEGAATGDQRDRQRSQRDVQRLLLLATQSRVKTSAADVERAEVELLAFDSRIEAAAAAIGAAEASLDRAQALRADADILAPFAGVVLRKEAEVGEMVAPVNAAGSSTRGAIVTLADFASLEMEVDVIERDIGGVAPGLPCRIVLDARKTTPYAGRARQVVPTADRTRGTVQVKVTFDALDEHVLPEMSGRVDFLEPEAVDRALAQDEITVPEAAVVHPDGDAVFVVDGDVARLTPVQLSPAAEAGLRRVIAGLRGGEAVILSPAAEVRDGGAVRVVTGEP